MEVLIDTYWNVNEALIAFQDAHKKVLIDTYWNVNLHKKAAPKERWCFNRYILECKLDSRKRKMGAYSVLIDTYWNVNFYASHLRVTPFLVLIDTYWNVNDSYDVTLLLSYCVLIDTYWNVNVATVRNWDSKDTF